MPVSFEIAKYFLIGVAARGGGQGGGHQGQHRLLEHIGHGGQKYRHAVLAEHAVHQALVGGEVPGAHRDVPEAVSLLPGQAEDLRRRLLHLPPGIRGGQADHAALSRPALGGLGEQLLLQMDQAVRALQRPQDGMALHRHPLPLGQPGQIGRRPAGWIKDIRWVARVAGQGRRHWGLGHELPQHRSLLGGKVSKTPHPDLLSLGPAGIPEGLGQPVQTAAGIGPSLGGQGLIGGVNEADVPQLLPLWAAQGFPRPGEGLGGDGVAAALVDGGQEACEESGLPGGGLVAFEHLLHLAHGPVEQQHPPPRVQGGDRSSPRHIGHPSPQPGKREHLAPAGSGIA